MANMAPGMQLGREDIRACKAQVWWVECAVSTGRAKVSASVCRCVCDVCRRALLRPHDQRWLLLSGSTSMHSVSWTSACVSSGALASAQFVQMCACARVLVCTTVAVMALACKTCDACSPLKAACRDMHAPSTPCLLWPWACALFCVVFA